MEFLITFGFFGLMFLPLMLMFIFEGADIQHKVGGAIFSLAFWILISGALYFQEEGNAERWNDGYCECGTHWELKGVNKSRNGTETKYYACDNCFKEIEIIH